MNTSITHYLDQTTVAFGAPQGEPVGTPSILSMVIVVRELQRLKASSPIEVTLLGISILVSDEQE